MLGGNFGVEPIEPEAMDVNLDDGLDYDDDDIQGHEIEPRWGGGFVIRDGDVTIVHTPCASGGGSTTVDDGRRRGDDHHGPD